MPKHWIRERSARSPRGWCGGSVEQPRQRRAVPSAKQSDRAGPHRCVGWGSPDALKLSRRFRPEVSGCGACGAHAPLCRDPDMPLFSADISMPFAERTWLDRPAAAAGRLRGYRDPVPLRPAGGRLATGDRGGGARRLRHQRPGGRHAYPREATEAFLNGHVSAFAFLVGVPRSVLYDTATLAVARIVGDGTRRCTRAFTHLQSYYPFRDRFGRPGKGNDKGKVEALVKTARRRFFVPIPKPRSIAPPIPSSGPRTGPVSERKHQHRGTDR